MKLFLVVGNPPSPDFTFRDIPNELSRKFSEQLQLSGRFFHEGKGFSAGVIFHGEFSTRNFLREQFSMGNFPREQFSTGNFLRNSPFREIFSQFYMRNVVKF